MRHLVCISKNWFKHWEAQEIHESPIDKSTQ